MARSSAASASARPDSIKGLAQSVANPAYRRLVTAEPVLRRAVPILIIAFLVTIGVGAIVQVLEHRRQALTDTRNEIETLAELIGQRLERQFARLDAATGVQAALESVIPHAIARGKRILVSDPTGRIVAAWPPREATRPATLTDVLGSEQPLTTFGAQAGALEITLPDGAQAFGTVHH
ncbi:MAG: PAS domain-containing sensor histidine kinase, partial [Variibacter sp.]|nr:PAS domain-containing sensor histidine kinase [Variibacter sp.]